MAYIIISLAQSTSSPPFFLLSHRFHHRTLLGKKNNNTPPYPLPPQKQLEGKEGFGGNEDAKNVCYNHYIRKF